METIPRNNKGIRFPELFNKETRASITPLEAEALWGLVFMTNPRRIIELGTYRGVSSIYIASALKACSEYFNGRTKACLHTVDKNDFQVMEKAKEYGLEDYIQYHHTDSLKFVREIDGPIDFVFYDAEATAQLYLEHYNIMREKMTKDGLYAIHDLSSNVRFKEHEALEPYIKDPYLNIYQGKGLKIIQINGKK